LKKLKNKTKQFAKVLTVELKNKEQWIQQNEERGV
jgi:hypothetical protein